jgi:hypothetical protein
MSSKNSNSLKELKGLREAVLAEEKAKTQERLKSLPPGPSALAREELAPPAQPVFDRQNDVEEDISLVPAPKSPMAQATSLRPAPASPAPPVNRPKPNQDPALIIPLTPKIQERLQKHIENSRWSQADLVIELIRAFLHRGYPEVQFGEQVIARAGSYRTFERNPLDTVLKIVSGQGVFDVTVTNENSEYQNWLSYFNSQKAANSDRSARQVCLFGLQTYLESVEDFKAQGWVKTISPDGYLVAPAA